MRRTTALTCLTILLSLPAFAGETIRRGAPLRNETPTPLSSILRSPGEYEGKNVLTEGRIERSCRTKGCWMELSADEGSMRVSFRDYAFFVPPDAAGADARVDGTVKVRKLTKAEADHLEEDGGKVVRQKDGTAVEISFIADGVELTRAH